MPHHLHLPNHTTYPCPLSNGMWGYLIVPEDGRITHSQAERMCQLLHALVIPEPTSMVSRAHWEFCPDQCNRMACGCWCHVDANDYTKTDESPGDETGAEASETGN